VSIYQLFVISIHSSFSGKNTRIPILPLWDCMGPARPGRSRAPGTRLENQVAAAPVWHDRPCHLLESTDAGLTECMFCANAPPGLVPSRYDARHHGRRGREHAVRGGPTRTPPADGADRWGQVPTGADMSARWRVRTAI